MLPQSTQVASPCVRECVIEPRTGYCLGCFRTLDEICCWASYTPEERQRVTEHLQARRAAHRDGSPI